ncbi:hypothetical protein TNCV_944171 [Trichonephila clavipes]|nr:hypothetical protein TNCV_944171 [Trichonephila clavipes]
MGCRDTEEGKNDDVILTILLTNASTLSRGIKLLLARKAYWSATLVFGYHFDMAKKRILTQDEIDRYMNNLDELSELNEDGLECSDDYVDFLPDCVPSIEDSDGDSEISVGSQNTEYKKIR